MHYICKIKFSVGLFVREEGRNLKIKALVMFFFNFLSKIKFCTVKDVGFGYLPIGNHLNLLYKVILKRSPIKESEDTHICVCVCVCVYIYVYIGVDHSAPLRKSQEV